MGCRRVSRFFHAGFVCVVLFLLPLAAAGAASPKKSFDAAHAVRDGGSVAFPTKKAKAVLEEMGLGWNLGNALELVGGEGLSSETSGGMPPVTQDMFRALAASGIKTVRIPVSWHNHITDAKCTIDPAWMRRVKTVVDWAIAEGMFVILNMHHDNASTSLPKKGQGYYPDVNSKLISEDFLINVWAQIALAFNNGYDHHLIFELLNEPRLIGTEFEWDYQRNDMDCLSSMGVIHAYEQTCLDVIRASRGNNKKRIVMVPAYGASADAALSGTFFLPKDVAPDRLAISVHLYLPEQFASASPGDSVLTQDYQDVIASYFSALYEKFVVEKIPVAVTECGATNKDNLTAREMWFSCFFDAARRDHIPCVLWDNGRPFPGEDEDYTGRYGLFNREDCTWYFPSLLDAALQALRTETPAAAE